MRRAYHYNSNVPAAKVPLGRLIRTHVHLSPEVHNAVREFAFHEHLSFAGALELLLIQALKRRRRCKPSA